MLFKKIGTIKNVSNSSAFHAIPKEKWIVVNNLQCKKGAELMLYKDFQLVQKVSIDLAGELRKFTPKNTSVFAVDNWKVFFIEAPTGSTKSYALAGQITAKIGDNYLINNTNLHNFETRQGISFEKWIESSPNYDSYCQVHPQVESIIGYVKTTNQPNLFADAYKTYVSAFSLKTGKAAWEYTFIPNKGDESKTATSFELTFIGSNQHQVWLVVSNGQMVILDASTGRELSRVGQPKWAASSPADIALQELGRSYLDTKKWVALNKHHYLEVSTTTFKLKYTNLQEEFDKYKISCMLSCFDKKYIYFYDSNWMSHSARGKVAILDRKTLKIVWYWDMLKELGTAPLHIEVVDNQLYVLDNGLTLHVFETSN